MGQKIRPFYPGYRFDIGRSIVLGLELLAGADIISPSQLRSPSTA